MSFSTRARKIATCHFVQEGMGGYLSGPLYHLDGFLIFQDAAWHQESIWHSISELAPADPILMLRRAQPHWSDRGIFAMKVTATKPNGELLRLLGEKGKEIFG